MRTGMAASRGDAGFNPVSERGCMAVRHAACRTTLCAALNQLQSALVSVRGKRDLYAKSIKKPDT